jgi:hypothetical protein
VFVPIEHLPECLEATWPELYEFIVAAQTWDRVRASNPDRGDLAHVSDRLAASVTGLVASLPRPGMLDRSTGP